jgi:hypothetical protein
MSTLSRREEMAVSGAALSGAPWSAATVTGGVVAAGDLGLQLIGGHIGLTMLSGPLSLGVVAFFAVAAAGALIRARHTRALAWARNNPWKFALMPALACAAVILPVALVLGGAGVQRLLARAARVRHHRGRRVPAWPVLETAAGDEPAAGRTRGSGTVRDLRY